MATRDHTADGDEITPVPRTLTAYAMSETMVVIVLTEFERALDAMRKGFTLRVYENSGWQGQYNLSGTFRALDATLDCAIYWYINWQKTREGEIIQKKSDGAQPVLYEIAARYLAENQISEFGFIEGTASPDVFSPFPVIWSYESGFGAVRLLQKGENNNVNAVGVEALTSFARACPADFAAGSSITRSISGLDARMIKAGCQTEKSMTMYYSTIIETETAFFEILLSEDSDSAQSDGKPPQLERDFATETASFVVERF